MKVKTPRDLFIHELRDLHSAEKQLLKALPKMAKAAAHEDLRAVFEEHTEQTETHVERLEEIFERLEVPARGEKCAAMEVLLEETAQRLKAGMPAKLLDAALIAVALRVEHYEIAGYASARTFAEILSEDEAAELLGETLEEEKEAAEKLVEIAARAVDADAGAEEDEE